MVKRIVLAVVVAVGVALACLLVGALLEVIKADVTTVVGSFLVRYSGLLGLLAGIWYYFTHSVTI